MPTNVTAEYTAAEQEYAKASTTAEKISALEKMLKEVPKHKGTEKLRQEIKTKLAKYRSKKDKELKQKSKGRAITLKKEGAATVTIVGPPNTGKSLLLHRLTGAKATVADYEFTTKMPVAGIMDYLGLKLQILEIPAMFKGYYESEKGPQFLSIIRQSDLVIILTDKGDLDDIFLEFKKANIVFNETYEDDEIANLKGVIFLNSIKGAVEKEYQALCRYYTFRTRKVDVKEEDTEKFKKIIWDELNLMKIRTKEPGKKVSKGEPLCLKKGESVRDMASHVHKDFIQRFRFARIWGRSAKFPGQQVGLGHRLCDEDIVEIHLRK